MVRKWGWRKPLGVAVGLLIPALRSKAGGLTMESQLKASLGYL